MLNLLNRPGFLALRPRTLAPVIILLWCVVEASLQPKRGWNSCNRPQVDLAQPLGVKLPWMSFHSHLDATFIEESPILVCVATSIHTWLPSLNSPCLPRVIMSTCHLITTLNMVFSVRWYFMSLWWFFWMTLLMNKWTNGIMDDGWVHPWATTPTFSC
jgi:hypothetical protein